MKPTRKIALAAVAAVAAYAVIRSFGGAPSASDDAEDPSLLVGRAWFDSQPEKYTDYVQATFLSDRAPAGVFQRSSAYDYRFEIFRFKRDNSQVEYTFPQTGKTAKVTFSIKGCNDMPPFDLCLDLSDNPWGGPKRYHAMREEEEEGGSLAAARDALRARAEGGKAEGR